MKYKHSFPLLLYVYVCTIDAGASSAVYRIKDHTWNISLSFSFVQEQL